MNTVIRCHIKTEERLKLLKLTCESWKEKKLHRIGKLYIADDQSPMQAEVEAVAKKYRATLVRSEGTPSTNNGLYTALKAQDVFPALMLVDDVVLATGVREKLEKIVDKELPLIPNWGTIQLFVPASVAHNFRTEETLVADTKLHKVDSSSWLWHAWVANVWSRDLADLFIRHWDEVKSGQVTDDGSLQDDHRARIIANKHGLGIYTTTTCYCWHTGGNERSFVDSKAGGSNYQAHKFCGSNEDKRGF